MCARIYVGNTASGDDMMRYPKCLIYTVGCMCGDIHVLYNQVCNFYVKSLKPAVHPNDAKNVSIFFLTHSAASPSKRTGGFVSFRRTMVFILRILGNTKICSVSKVQGF